MHIRLVELAANEIDGWLPAALDVYVAAMGYPRGTQAHRAPLWRDHALRTGWRAIGAIGEPERVARIPSAEAQLVGIAYGYRGAPDQWWHQQLCTGLRSDGHSAANIMEITRDYFELTELHVHPDYQGNRIGERLLHKLIADRREARVLLSTPEAGADGNRAWALYRRFGFTDVLRNFGFPGDPRPFAILERALPLSAPTKVMAP